MLLPYRLALYRATLTLPPISRPLVPALTPHGALRPEILDTDFSFDETVAALKSDLLASIQTSSSSSFHADWLAFMDRYLPGVDKTNSLTIYGYTVAEAMIEVLKRCGDDFGRDNVMRQAAALKSLRLPMLLPGIIINTSATDHAPLEQMVMMRFSAGRWEHIGPVRSGIDPGAVSDSFKAIFRYGSSTQQTAGQQNANTVTMMTGAFGGTYVQIGADLATVLDDGANFRLLPEVGRGSVQAVADILFLKGVDVGIVRKDTLAYLERKGYANNIRSQLAYVAKLYTEEMHVVAPKAIHTMQDLDGKSVAVDLPDGGTFVTSINVFERLRIKIAPGQQVDTLAAEAILASYNWQPSNSDRYRRLSRLVETTFSHVAQLQQPPFHPKWRELATGASVSGWTRARPAQEWLDKNAAPAATLAVKQPAMEENRAQFEQFLDERAAARGPTATRRPEGREAIFNEFLQWQASRSIRR
jgi:hypothetical protein